jgi:predicted MFS family arabinose efflux permease
LSHCDTRARGVDREFRGLLVSATAALALALLPITILPLLIGTWVDHLGASATRAGVIGAAELGGMALASFALAPRMHVLSRRRVAVAAGLGVLLTHAVSAAVADLDLLLAVRVLAGLCAGSVLASASAAIAGAREPERMFAWTGVLGGILAAAVLVATPLAIERAQTPGAFVALALFAAASLPFLLLLPARAPDRTFEAEAEPPRAGSRAALALLAAGALMAVAQGAIWAFSERIGGAVQLSPRAIGWVLGGAPLMGIGGSVLAGILGLTRGRGGPLLFGYAGCAVSIALVASASGGAAFSVGQLALALTFNFTSPYLMGLAAALDPQGRISAALSGALLIGAGIGPGLAGVVVEWGAFSALGGVSVLVTGMSAVLLLPVLRSLHGR